MLIDNEAINTIFKAGVAVWLYWMLPRKKLLLTAIGWFGCYLALKWLQLRKMERWNSTATAPLLSCPLSSFGSCTNTRGNILGIQLKTTPLDYSSEARFHAKLAQYFSYAQNNGYISENTVVVLPEYTGTWLVESMTRSAYLTWDLHQLLAAQLVIISLHLPTFLVSLIRSRSVINFDGFVDSDRADNQRCCRLLMPFLCSALPIPQGYTRILSDLWPSSTDARSLLALLFFQNLTLISKGTQSSRLLLC